MTPLLRGLQLGQLSSAARHRNSAGKKKQLKHDMTVVKETTEDDSE